MPGMRNKVAIRLIPSGKDQQMSSAFMICWAMFGNGVRICMTKTTIPGEKVTIREGQFKETFGFCEEEPLIQISNSAAQARAVICRLLIDTILSVFGWSES